MKINNYKSVGQILKNKDFKKLNELLSSEEHVALINELKKIEEGNYYSELDKILYYIPEYAYNKEKKSVEPFVKEVIEKIINLGGDPNKGIFYLRTPFMMACELKTSEISRLYSALSYIDLNKKDGRGDSALIHAVLNDSAENLDFLVKELGMDVNETNLLLKNNTALHYACGNVFEESIKKLMELGANPLIRNSNDLLPCETIPSEHDDLENEYKQEEKQNWDNVFEYVKNYTKEKEQLSKKIKI